MPTIEVERYYDGVQHKIARLGIQPLLDELRQILTGWQLLLKEEKDANGGAEVRKLIDKRFQAANSKIRDKRQRWKKKTSGGIDWMRSMIRDKTTVAVGVEIQVSARSDIVAVDLLHFNKALRDGELDLCILVVPTDTMSLYLPDRTPSVSESERMLDMFDAHTIPLVFWAIEHDGPGPALKKQKRRA